MSSGQSQTRSRSGPPRPTTARRNHAGLVISLVLHGGLIAATLLTLNRVVDMSPESHAVPVELVVAQQTNVRAEAPPQVEKEKVEDTVKMDEPPLPPFVDAEPAPLPPVPQIKIVVPKLQAISNNGYDQRIFVRGDTSANYGQVMIVMGMLSAAGFTHIGLVTDVQRPKPDAQ